MNDFDENVDEDNIGNILENAVEEKTGRYR